MTESRQSVAAIGQPQHRSKGNSTDRDHALGLARGFGAAGLRTTLGWQIARTLFRIGFAGALAVFAGRLIEDDAFDVTAISGALACLALSACAGVFGDLAAASAEERVVDRLRAALQDALSLMSPLRIRTKPAGALVAGLQRYPGALAGLVISHSAAKSMLAIGPLLAAVAVALVSWEAALTLFVTVPVMVVFFVLLGGVVRGRAEAQEKAFGRLAAQFSDRIRTLPTILANHALLSEHDKIEQRMTLYADSTMAVLKVAFLNAGIIDFFSAIAIAVLAVFLGLSHLGLMHVPGFSGLALWQSLFILIIAAEFFTPFRRYAEQYHVKAEGQAAARELDWYFDEAAEKTAGTVRPVTRRQRLRCCGSSCSRPDRDLRAERLRKVDPAAQAGRHRDAAARFQVAASDDGRGLRLDIDRHLRAGGHARRSDRLESRQP